MDGELKEGCSFISASSHVFTHESEREKEKQCSDDVTQTRCVSTTSA